MPASTSLNKIVSLLSGVLISSGWWLIIDASVYGEQVAKVHLDRQIAWWHWLAPIASTLGVLAINTVSRSVISTDQDNSMWGEGGMSTATKRAVLFAIMALIMSGIGLGVFIFALDRKGSQGSTPFTEVYPKLALLIGTVLIAASGLLFKFGRAQKEDDGFGF